MWIQKEKEWGSKIGFREGSFINDVTQRGGRGQGIRPRAQGCDGGLQIV